MLTNILLCDLKVCFQQLNILIDGKQNIFLLNFQLLIDFSQSLIDFIEIVDHLALFQP